MKEIDKQIDKIVMTCLICASSCNNTASTCLTVKLLIAAMGIKMIGLRKPMVTGEEIRSRNINMNRFVNTHSFRKTLYKNSQVNIAF